MPPPRFFRLQVADLTGSGRFNLRLWNETDQLLATHVVQVPEAGPALIRWCGLLALDDYLEVEQGRSRSADALMIELGDFLTQQVLGEPLAAHLFQRQRLGTLFVELPVERRPEALELTRYAGKWLADAGLGVQIVPQALLPPGPQLADALQAIQPFDPGGPLRVLLIFSLARGTTALAMREEREQLTSFFLGELASAYQVQVDLLQYGVTRVALEEAASQQGGYHLIHFSGHGVEHTAIGSDSRQQTRLGLLLERDDGGPDAITGEEFADIFRRNGDPPHLVFLSACHSGELGERWQLAQHGQTVFYLERLQPDWLPGGRRWLPAQGARLLAGLIGALVFGLNGGLLAGLDLGLLSGLIAAFIAALIGGLTGYSAEITPIEMVRWSWSRFLAELLLPSRRGLRGGLGSGLGLGLLAGLPFWLLARVDLVLRVGLLAGTLVGLATGLRYGGRACLQHLVLRLGLWYHGCTPRRYVDFLDYAAERLFLRRVGGGYIFIHRLLQDYFAAMYQPDRADSPPQPPLPPP